MTDFFFLRPFPLPTARTNNKEKKEETKCSESSELGFPILYRKRGGLGRGGGCWGRDALRAPLGSVCPVRLVRRPPSSSRVAIWQHLCYSNPTVFNNVALVRDGVSLDGRWYMCGILWKAIPPRQISSSSSFFSRGWGVNSDKYLLGATLAEIATLILVSELYLKDRNCYPKKMTY